MFNRVAGAALRALLVVVVVALPAMALPGLSSDVTQMVALLALAGGLWTFVEYMSSFPSVTEFRSAPPFNRLRFGALAAIVIALTLIVRNVAYPTSIGEVLATVGGIVGEAMDFPFSPVRLVLLDLPADVRSGTVEVVRTCAGLAYIVSLTAVIVFVSLVRIMNWPIRKHAFNVWVNLPRFDPTAGGDVLLRLKRDAHLNVALGFLLPFLIPAVMKVAASLGATIALDGPLTLVWVMTAWAFLPASLMMRGVALMKIADLIEEKRRRAYAQSGHFQPA